MYKKSAGPAPRWQPRFFAVMGHYLNYFSVSPAVQPHRLLDEANSSQISLPVSCAQDEKSAKDEKEDIKGSFDLDMVTQIHREQGTGQKITLYLAGAVKAEKLEVSAAVVLQKDAALLCV